MLIGKMLPIVPETLQSGQSRAASIPGGFSSFVGRAEELSEFAGLVERSRLLTLTGAPGIGKSRLALEGASKLSERYPDGSRLVELAALSDPALIPRTLASALSVQEVPGRSLIDAVLAHLGRRRLLLVLDNCEHLIGACANLVASLLSACPQLSIVATSREPLSITGETVWQVPPLTVPPVLDNELTVEALLDYGAVRLFVERASAVALGFELNAEHAGPVVEIVRRLDGIPLAIELAAARVDVLTPAEIAGGLDHRFELLTKGSRSDLPRHQTLEAALDWSHDLLTASERALLRRLSVFTGGFCLEACEGVCAGGEVGEEEVFHLLARLVAKSLVLADTANSRGRYRLLETIRAYAGDRLQEAAETDSLPEAHARVYLGLAERAEPELTGPLQTEWLQRLGAEHGNLRSALDWSLAQGQDEWALRLAGALILFWRVRCHFSEGRDLLEATIKAGEGDDPRLRARALWGAGFLAFMAGDPERARPVLEESLTEFRQLGDASGCARALLLLGNGRRFKGLDLSGELGELEESAALAREAGDTWCLAHALGAAGYAHEMASDLASARALFEEAVAVARQAGDQQGLRYGLLGLGKVARKQGDYPAAAAMLKETLTIVRELGEGLFEAGALGELGALAFGRGDYVGARGLLEEARDALPEAAPPGQGLGVLLKLASVAHAQGDRRRARALFEEAQALIHPWATAPRAFQGLGELAADEGDGAEAERLFEEALVRAPEISARSVTAQALNGLGHLARTAGDFKRASGLHNEALDLQRQLEELPGIVASLEAIGGVAAATGCAEHAARLLGAADALREQKGYARTPWVQARYEADLELVRGDLATEEFEAAFTQGAGLSLAEALAQACKGRKRNGRGANGWASLTSKEQEVVALVAEGLTNPQIAERLFITRETVKTHLSHVFSKVGVTTRRELELEVRRRREQAPPGDSER